MKTKQNIFHNNVMKIIENRLPQGLEIKPTRELYEELGINQKRFSAILSGSTKLYADELQAIAKWLQVEIKEIL